MSSPPRPNPRARGASLLEAVVALATGSLLLAGSASQAMQSSATVIEARKIADALTVGRNILDRALGAPCAAAGFAASICDPRFRCVLAGQALGQRLREDGSAWTLQHMTIEVFERNEGGEDRLLASVASVAAQPEVCG